MRMSSIKHEMKLFIVKSADGTQTLVENDGDGPEFIFTEDTKISSGDDTRQIVVSSNKGDLQMVCGSFLTDEERSNVKIIETTGSIRIYVAPGDLL
ncbi:hypothetical protein EVB32_114 [Rhizobium phage RHph_TM39]|uniref:Uncharacterized protein n=1 Tax=Rhizobium phage RHph_TM30 TaxID=2509764 RepID=A0A7S5R9H1_9CAUD|nr:hypothetical protein PQC16_gp114 [Rhizobium phage RHph_TM30]QIG71585.1 hypothetical protein EVB94_114 [Rhizobium phage RHph_TM40]QIG71948.1 hypothetical protein EVB95_114 [Rhizobium phage RHph_TM2_3B]QIG72310.1 hypothetical protein EVB96_114 [Rhizobium phage RHph_TM3_3_6]QIG77102.1 hypothetical protein EVB32_114 [Rhizobium phage RHph_TM39]QIG77440.1 hypothetical protein EVB61_112 [Rhizobium phage RHph_TM21B]QIG77701.1 hypothetical protein EVB64_114 [Rhizobium phage RHph_TM61]